MDPLPSRPDPSRPFSEVARAWLEWFGLARLVVTALAVLAVGAGGFWLLRSPAPTVESALPYAKQRGPLGAVSSSTSTVLGAVVASSTSVPSTALIVYVAGAVLSPGVYQVPANARVQNAVLAAGGPAPDADLDAMNLAAFIRDGDRVYVPHKGAAVPPVVGASPGAASAGKSASGQAGAPIDLNRATAEELDALPGVGPATAAAIVTYRDRSGPFSSVDDLLKVPGIGPAKVEVLRSLVKV
ncbi:MAG: helix-hairpin-helix domain-containing protein [Actinomycetota bacterium]